MNEIEWLYQIEASSGLNNNDIGAHLIISLGFMWLAVSAVQAEIEFGSFPLAV